MKQFEIKKFGTYIEESNSSIDQSNNKTLEDYVTTTDNDIKIEETKSFDEFLNEKAFAKKAVVAEAEKILFDAGYTKVEISEMTINNIIKTAKECKGGNCKKKSKKIEESTKSFDEFFRKDDEEINTDEDEENDKESNTGWGGEESETTEESTKESLKSFDEFFK